MIDKQQIEEMKNILLNSKAVTFEPNVQKLYSQYHSDEFYVSNNDGHLTIDYSKFAEALCNAGWGKVEQDYAELLHEYERLADSHIQAMELVRKVRAKRDMLEKQLAEAGKEIAKEIYEQLCEHDAAYVKKWIKNQYNMEVK